MRLNCNINGQQYSIVVNSDKPLSQILREQIVSFSENSQCLGASCGNCIVLLNGTAVLSCLVPAFKANGASILTFEGFQKTRFCHDIERAYTDVGNQPCPQCYAAKTILIESIINRMDKGKQDNINSVNANQNAAKSRSGNTIDQEAIKKEMGLSSCRCIEISDLEKIITLAYRYRSKRRVRKS